MTSIRAASPSDAPAFLELCLALDAETEFMMLEPGERTTSPEQQAEILRGLAADPGSHLLVAESGARLVGFVAAHGGRCRRAAHKAHVVLGVLQSESGRGLGTRLLAELEAWAERAGLRRLGLTVMAHNERAVALYLRRGFLVEGTIRDSLCVDGRFVDELSMAKLLAGTPRRGDEDPGDGREG